MKRRDASHPGPLVTVLISTYNRPAYLAEALESIFAQSWPHFQIVLVRDGGCPVRPVTERFNDRRLVFIDRDVNRGLPYSFNEALDKAEGEYICYLGDDDRFFPHHLETLLTAMESQDECQAVYSDLYKAHCRVTGDGRRIVLAKNVEISRDFDRLLMLQFNHALHVSLMHRRDLLEKAGPYNESLNVLIDWDLTRRMCFYTDFLHVPVVTGEYYAPVGDCDRISVQRRKNVNEYLRNLLTIRSTRPAKPWDCIEDLSIIVTADGDSPALRQTLRNIWSHVFYPNQMVVPLCAAQAAGLQAGIPNVVAVPTEPGLPLERRIDRALERCEGELVAIFPVGLPVENDEVAWIERPLNVLLNHPEGGFGVELIENRPGCEGYVLRTCDLLRARREFAHLPLEASLRAAGIAIRKPEFEEFPFLFDHTMTGAEQVQQEGNWAHAARIYEHLEEHYGNEIWMQTRRANALIRAGSCREALDLLAPLNEQHATPATLLLEGRAWKQLREYQRAVGPLRRAEAILAGAAGPEIRQDWTMHQQTVGSRMPQQETSQWT